MKNKILLVLCVWLFGCGGSLSDEQRKKLHDGMEDQIIVKLSDSEIVTASLEQGRAIYNAMKKTSFDSSSLDSIAHHHQATIKLVTPGSGSALQIESQLIE